MQADQVMGYLEAEQPGRVGMADVQLEATASLSVQRDGGIFRGFAGCIKAELQWLPLQWTYLARGAAVPALMRTRRAARRTRSNAASSALTCTWARSPAQHMWYSGQHSACT